MWKQERGARSGCISRRHGEEKLGSDKRYRRSRTDGERHGRGAAPILSQRHTAERPGSHYRQPQSLSSGNRGDRPATPAMRAVEERHSARAGERCASADAEPTTIKNVHIIPHRSALSLLQPICLSHPFQPGSLWSQGPGECLIRRAAKDPRWPVGENVTSGRCGTRGHPSLPRPIRRLSPA